MIAWTICRPLQTHIVLRNLQFKWAKHVPSSSFANPIRSNRMGGRLGELWRLLDPVVLRTRRTPLITLAACDFIPTIPLSPWPFLQLYFVVLMRPALLLVLPPPAGWTEISSCRYNREEKKKPAE